MDKQHIRVLLVDDDEDDYVITRDLLTDIEGWKFDVEWASNYDDALQIIIACQHDVYLLDYRLGKQNGLDLLREALAAGCQAPIILMTGQGDRAVDLEAMRIGAADYLNKERVVDAAILERTLRYAIERAHTLAALREREEQLRQYAEELEIRNRELNAYSYTIAHDLKSPLSTVIGYADLLLSYFGEETTSEMKKYLQEIFTVSNNMASMIDQLLQLATLYNAEASGETLNMMTIAEAAVNRFKFQMEKHNVQIIWGSDLPPAIGYQPWVEEVFANLIGNAIKYRGSKSPHIQLRAKKLNGKVRYEVQDNGIGIAPEYLARIFEMFHRVPGSGVEGTGLGLAIVHRIVKKLNGDVGVDSQPGKGSTFWFTLPAAHR